MSASKNHPEDLSKLPQRNSGVFYRICCCPQGADRIAGWFALTILLGMLVIAGNQLLVVSSDLGVLDFQQGGTLGEPLPACAKTAPTRDRTDVVQACWTDQQKQAAPWLLALDSVWGPIYAWFLVLLYLRLISELIADSRGRRCGPTQLRSTPDDPAQAWRAMLLALLPIALLATDWFENWQTWRVLDAGADAALMHFAYQAKEALIRLNVVLVALLFAMWFFGLLFRVDDVDDRRQGGRAQLRRAVNRVVWRSRYVLLLLGLFAFLTLGMDQSRDVLVGLAQGLVPDAALSSGDASAADRLWVLAAFFISMLAVWMYAYACWLWSRIPARMRSPEADLLQEDGLESTDAAGNDNVVSVQEPDGKPVLGSEQERDDEPALRPERKPDGRDQFAKWWARWLGLLPPLMLIWLAGRASGDAMLVGIPTAVAGGEPAANAQVMAVVLFGFAVVTAVIALLIQYGFIRDRRREPKSARAVPSADLGPCGRSGKQSLYFNVVKLSEAHKELVQDNYRFALLLKWAPLSLPLLALFLFQVVRGFDLLAGGQVPVTLAVIALALTLWTCVLGLLAQAAQRQGMPWILALLVLVGLYGVLRFTDNHRVLTEAYQISGSSLLWGMWWAQVCFAVLLAAALVWGWLRLTRRSREDEPRLMRWLVDRLTWVPRALAGVGLVAAEDRGERSHTAIDFAFFALLALLAWPLLSISDRVLGPERAAAAGAAVVERKTLDAAIGDWTIGLLKETPGQPTDALPVYFVSAEGGGIRAGYWAALVLEQLTQRVTDFDARTFSISGVSGGSVGAAAWYACTIAKPGEPGEHCDLTQANLLTPLLSAWLFEDVLGTIVPTTAEFGPIHPCRTPGCGVLSRGLVFERSLEAALPSLRPALLEVNQQPPYLFLNSSRVEDGNRAIASVIRIDERVFASSVDQLDVLGPGMPLSTAAHNSARFTYVNAIGSAGEREEGKFIDRYHLADGGYFDNSGGHTSADIIRAFSRCLFDSAAQCGLDPETREEAQRRLLPQAIKIRNGIHQRPASSGGDEDEHSDACKPLQASEPRDLDFYPDVLGPPITAFNAIGTGANGRVAESGICRAVQAWRLLRAAALDKGAEDPAASIPEDNGVANAGQIAGPAADTQLVSHCDLVDENVLYPLGWYLSPTAAAGMRAAATRLGPECLMSATSMSSSSSAAVRWR